MNMKNIFFAARAGPILVLLAACSALRPAPQATPTATAEPLPASGFQYHLVTNKLMIPATQAQTEAFALNIDEDPQGSSDNKFGELLTLLASAAQGLELQSTLDQAINDGQLVSLHVVQADDPMNDPSVSWSIFVGQKTQSAPLFDGSDTFTLDSAAPSNPGIAGSLTNGRFSGGPGTAQVRMFLLSQSVEVDLIGLRLEADLSAAGCTNGKLGGGVTVEEFRGKVLPAIADGLDLITQADQATAATLLQVFDSDRNGTITTAELENNPLLMIAVSPDLDLLDVSGNFNPNQDRVKDSYSVGLGFTCVVANFTTP